jgi:hypothetical protein
MKIKILIAVLALEIMFGVVPVMAATDFSFSPVKVNTIEGKDFAVLVKSNPSGLDNYTTKMVINYPADLLEVNSFIFGENWMPLVQPGYSLIDNANGVLIKTGGYPFGYSSVVNFGTISFHAKKPGSGIVKIGSDSISYDANNNVINSSPSQFSFVIDAVPVVNPVVLTKPAKVGSTKLINDDSVKPIEKISEVVPIKSLEKNISEATVNQNGQASILDFSGSNNFKWFFLLLLLIILYLIYRYIKEIKKRRKRD